MNNTLFYGLATLVCGILGLLIRYSFKSKCSNIDICFGIITIKRDVNAEIQIEPKTSELDNSLKDELKL